MKKEDVIALIESHAAADEAGFRAAAGKIAIDLEAAGEKAAALRIDAILSAKDLSENSYSVPDEVRAACRTLLGGHSDRSIVICGRGNSGKTALLHEAGALAQAAGFLVSEVKAEGDDNLSDLLIAGMSRVLSFLCSDKNAESPSIRALGELRAFSAKYDVPVSCGQADSVDAAYERDFTHLVCLIGESAAAAGRGWVIQLDEMQRLSRRDLAALTAAIQRTAQEGLPVLLLAAAQPEIVAIIGQVKPYAERLYRFRSMGQ